MMTLRPEMSDDHARIFELTKAAFRQAHFSDGTEAERINHLRKDGDLHLSLVACDGNEIVGHVAFSPVIISESSGVWLGLGPVSVTPGRQKTGIGSKLIITGLDMIKRQGALGCALIGDPNYYSRFGFQAGGRLSYRDLPDAYVQWIAFSDVKPKGRLIYSPGLESDNINADESQSDK